MPIEVNNAQWLTENLHTDAKRTAEVVKIVATIALMGLAFATMELPPLGFFATFGVLQLVHVVGGTGLSRRAISR